MEKYGKGEKIDKIGERFGDCVHNVLFKSTSTNVFVIFRTCLQTIKRPSDRVFTVIATATLDVLTSVSTDSVLFSLLPEQHVVFMPVTLAADVTSEHP